MEIEKFEKLVGKLHDKTKYVIHIRMIKFRVIKFNQNAWLKPYIDMNIDVSFWKNYGKCEKT